ncbi:MAG TPA: WYL domain-containing protein [Candidatus Dormibacteraeota bacterium]|nr:WYL domain-containing protein [Candidatus Dormibacteraeota bacterium]
MLEDGRGGGKRDRLARFYRVLAVLQAHGEAGVHVDEIARRVGMSKRTVYRDLRALESEIAVPLWNDDHGTWGLAADALLPPLKLTLLEAMAVVISARLMARYADKYDPDLAAAFQKLEEVLPPALAEPVERTLSVLATRPRDARFSRHVHLLTRAWAERRVVTFTYLPARYSDAERPPRAARVRPYLIEPSLSTHALYLIGFDEARDAVRTFKIERIEDLAVAPDSFEPPASVVLEEVLGRAWDIIADQPPVEVALRFAPSVAGRVQETTWHPTQLVEPEADGSLLWRATVSGTVEIRLWILSWGDEVEVLAPAELRDDVARTLRRALDRYTSGPA